MLRLPVIVGFGGVNAAGRSSFHHAHNRMIFDALNESQQATTLQSLASLMNIDTPDADLILPSTLVRKIESSLLDTENVTWNKRFPVAPNDDNRISFTTKPNALPEVIPPGWTVTELGDRRVRVDIAEAVDFLLPTTRSTIVRSAGQLPAGFEPGKLYQSRNHPRGIQMTVYGASDALSSMGIAWDDVRARVAPDMISVYAGSGMSQLDLNGNGGMMMARLTGKKVTSKQCPFGFAEMPADFINAYLLGSIGTTGTSMGACASFLYNLRSGIQDIQSGRSRVVIVGNAEAPITSEVIDGYAAMGALATDDELRQLDGRSADQPCDHTRACRPFSTNKGFTLAESAQFLVLMDDELAMELGANIHGAVSDVFINADGYKKSISAPGVGNYVTVAKAMAAARSIVGEKAFRERSFFQAHGTGTPQNRLTESHIIDMAARSFGIDKWLVGAVKSYLGHSIGCAAGDQIVTSLGIWNSGIFPGIHSIDHIAEDVHQDNVNYAMEHVEVGQQGMDVGIINAKGFGGNNATATLLAPHIAQQMLAKKHGKGVISAWQDKNAAVQQAASDYDSAATAGDAETIYRFDYQVANGDSVTMSQNAVTVDGFENAISLDFESPYAEFLK
ncbi:Beta-ketoacyl-[acyl-carrier-protein] synthase FabY [BD1-7 clade bacterium]|uniref:Beta-ketoacyl-[acyl-carrier-protein] synthase FabY n=1 Tax=BD1-7 clade bacterium TaxID=2029982 RepID=A0A5S9R0K9_9GAMM|nr:Beta-ketoacyl-[acyl-carrier-protein] synthase FabY [BD1-7 clade bacterium]